jgi:uncharacterized membrane protein
MFGYGWPEFHAAVNDLPAALLLAAVLFDLAGAFTKRESLSSAGLWCLVLGVLGTLAAIGSGLMAEEGLDHTDRAHAVMETHETLAFIVLGIFGPLLVWRLLRRGVWRPRELPIALTAGVIGVALMVVTTRLGGGLVFDHAMGLSTPALQEIVGERTGHGGSDHEHDAPAAAAGDSAAPGDSAAGAAAPHPHRDSTPHRHD